MVEDYHLVDLSDHLQEAFQKWLSADGGADQGCRAKTSLARALTALEVTSVEHYLEGARRVQSEPVYGGSEDTAGELRGLCGIGLVRSYYAHTLEVLADLLADKVPVTRVLAAKALLELGGPESAALLRFRLQCGEEEPTVLLECLTGLMVLTGERGLQFTLRRYTKSPRDPFWPVGVLALGESGTEEACSALIEMYDGLAMPSYREQVLEAVALSRSDRSLDFLFQRVESGNSEEARFAQDLIGRFWGDKTTQERLKKMIE